ncbi:hypothetical protein ACB098_11G097300 [Castanea mollissima]
MNTTKTQTARHPTTKPQHHRSTTHIRRRFMIQPTSPNSNRTQKKKTPPQPTSPLVETKTTASPPSSQSPPQSNTINRSPTTTGLQSQPPKSNQFKNPRLNRTNFSLPNH